MKSIAKNKKAYFDYEILEDFEAGIMLRGHEVKAARAGKVNLKGSHVIVKDEGVFVQGMHVGMYEQANLTSYDPYRPRQILLHAKERDQLVRAENESGSTVIPLEMYLKKGLIKLKIGIVRGKKKHDKRHGLKQKSQDRDVQRALKRYK